MTQTKSSKRLVNYFFIKLNKYLLQTSLVSTIFGFFFTQNIQSTYQAVTTTDKDGTTTTNYVANSAQSLLAESMLGFTKDSAFVPTEQDVLIQLFSDDKRFFVTESTTANPMFQITGVFELYLCIFYQATWIY